MLTPELWDEPPALPPFSASARPAAALDRLPLNVAASLWRGSELGSPTTQVLGTGWDALDRELPGGGWPCQAITELLQPQPSVSEFRLLGPVLRDTVTAGKIVVIVGPPKPPHLPGLRHLGMNERQLIWIQVDAPAQRLWATEQLIKSSACGLIISWLPQARQEQLRRLQICAQANPGPVFLCRPMSAEHEPSAAPLRLQVRFGVDWALHVHVLKRRGSTHEGFVTLDSVPGGLASVITPRLRRPSALLAPVVASEVVSDVVGSPAPSALERRTAAH
jgi:protein ImuA